MNDGLAEMRCHGLANAVAYSRPRHAKPLKIENADMRGRAAWKRVVSEPRRKAHQGCWVVGLRADNHGPRQLVTGGVPVNLVYLLANLRPRA